MYNIPRNININGSFFWHMDLCNAMCVCVSACSDQCFYVARFLGMFGIFDIVLSLILNLSGVKTNEAFFLVRLAS